MLHVTDLEAISMVGSAAPGTVLVLSCMDHRLMPAIAALMEQRGLAGRYDHIVLAGGALGVMCSDNPAWRTVFMDHLGLARSLHGVDRLIVVDHRDCGACKQFVGADCADDPASERETHRGAIDDLRELLAAEYPNLVIEAHLMDLTGDTEPL